MLPRGVGDRGVPRGGGENAGPALHRGAAGRRQGGGDRADQTGRNPRQQAPRATVEGPRGRAVRVASQPGSPLLHVRTRPDHPAFGWDGEEAGPDSGRRARPDARLPEGRAGTLDEGEDREEGVMMMARKSDFMKWVDHQVETDADLGRKAGDDRNELMIE